MANVVVVGAQWGDEGKGKVVDLYSEFADVVVRFGGGANAGHTLVVDGKKVVTHLIPSGVLRGRGKKCVLASGMVIDPQTLLEEIASLKALGFLTDDRDLLVSRDAHVILPYHRELDGLRESGKQAIGTTRRGIGPAYEAKMARRGIRMADLGDAQRLRSLIAFNLEEIAPYMTARQGRLEPLEKMVSETLAHGEKLRRYLGDASIAVHQAMRRGEHVLFEGAQGALLDIDHGTYPYVTSSSTLAGGACTGCGIGPTAIDAVIGITKAYATRVGSGPFPTELKEETGERLRQVGAEFGSTTGRPRRTGWLDVAALRRAARQNGLSSLALTKLDVLSGLPKLRLCVGYRLGSNTLDELPVDPVEVEMATPIYEELDGFVGDSTHLREYDALPKQAQKYVRRIESLIGVDVSLISVGPGRAETILMKNPFR